MGLYCVMPYNGSLPFLRKKRARDARNSVCANALKRASLISTEDGEGGLKLVVTSVNALKRASLISTETKNKRRRKEQTCVNALKRASLISTSTSQSILH